MNDFKVKRVGLIVGLTQDNYIGYENDLMMNAMHRRMELPEKMACDLAIKADMTYFREVTKPKEGEISAVIMGRRTWESIPSRPLPKRTNVVITSDERYRVPSSVLVFRSLEEALEETIADVGWLIGGAGIYDEGRNYATDVRICRFEFKASDYYSPHELKTHGVLAPDWMKSPEDYEYTLTEGVTRSDYGRWRSDHYDYHIAKAA